MCIYHYSQKNIMKIVFAILFIVSKTTASSYGEDLEELKSLDKDWKTQSRICLDIRENHEIFSNRFRDALAQMSKQKKRRSHSAENNKTQKGSPLEYYIAEKLSKRFLSETVNAKILEPYINKLGLVGNNIDQIINYVSEKMKTYLSKLHNKFERCTDELRLIQSEYDRIYIRMMHNGDIVIKGAIERKDSVIRRISALGDVAGMKERFTHVVDITRGIRNIYKELQNCFVPVSVTDNNERFSLLRAMIIGDAPSGLDWNAYFKDTFQYYLYHDLWIAEDTAYLYSALLMEIRNAWDDILLPKLKELEKLENILEHIERIIIELPAQLSKVKPFNELNLL